GPPRHAEARRNRAGPVFRHRTAAPRDRRRGAATPRLRCFVYNSSPLRYPRYISGLHRGLYPKLIAKPNTGAKTRDEGNAMTDYARLLEAEIPRLRRYARALTRDVTRADDLVQSCLARAVAKQ